MQHSSRNRSGTTTTILVYGLSQSFTQAILFSSSVTERKVGICRQRQLRRNRKQLQQRTTINGNPAVANETTPGQAFVPDQSMGQEPQGQQSPSLLGKPPDLQSSGQPPSPSPSLGQSPQAVRGSSTALLQPSTEQYRTRSGRVVVKPTRFIED